MTAAALPVVHFDATLATLRVTLVFASRWLRNMEATSGPTGIESSVRDRLIRQIWHGADPFAEFPFRPERVDIQGWDGSNHYSFETAIRVIRPRIIVEIGVWKGASSLHMAEALRRYGIEGVVVAVDTWLGASDHSSTRLSECCRNTMYKRRLCRFDSHRWRT